MKPNDREVDMDERFRDKRHWIGLGALVIVFLCVALCALGAMGTVGMSMMRSETAYVQPPAGEEGAVPPPTYHGHGPLGRFGGTGPFHVLGFGIKLIFGLLFFGLLALLLIGLVKRLFWGHRWGWAPYGGRPPKGKKGEGKSDAWGPWGWHHHRKHWGPPPWWAAEPEASGEEGEPDAEDPEYAGPQE
jgi:hypothetical protein